MKKIVLEIDDDEYNSLDDLLRKISTSSESRDLHMKLDLDATFEHGERHVSCFPGNIYPYIPLHLEDFNISKSDINVSSVVIAKFNPETMNAYELSILKSELHNIFPANKVLFIANDIEFLVQERDAAIEMLNKMIAHIQILG